MDKNNNISPISQGILSYLNKNVNKEEKDKILLILKEKLEAEDLLAKITTAVELTAEEKEKIIKYLQNKYFQKIKIEFLKDPKILGGIKIKIGDTLIDQSFSGILTKISRILIG